MECHFRIGNERYSKKYKSYGTTTLENHHVKVKKDSVIIDFIGKKKVRNICTVKNKKVVKTLKEKKRTLKKNDRIFTYRNGSQYYNIKSSDVNKYLKQFGNFSAKNFRTWTANVDLIKELQKQTTDLKKHLSQSIKRIAERMHHTPSICKKNYINNELLDLYINSNDRFRYYFRSKTKQGICDDFVQFLKDIYL